MKSHRLSGLFGILLLGVLATPVVAQTAPPAEIVCIQCHSTLPEKFSRPVILWRGSIHDENNVACNDCHGGNPTDVVNAMNPAQGFLGVPKEQEIPTFCGRCHIGVLKDYLASQHGQALGRGGPTCVTCHGSHQVVKAAPTIINEQLCGSCHSYERAARIKTIMAGVDGRIAALDARITAHKREGTDTDRVEKGLFAARNRYHSLFHTVDMQVVERETGQISAGLNKIQGAVQQIDDEHRRRRIIGFYAVCAALLLALVAHLMRKTYD